MSMIAGPTQTLRLRVAALGTLVTLAAIGAVPSAHAQTAGRRIVDDRNTPPVAASEWKIERFGETRTAVLRAMAEPTGRVTEAEIVSRGDDPPRAQLVRGLELESGHVYRVSVEVAGSSGTNVELMLRRRPAPYDAVALRSMQLNDSWRTVTMEAAWPVTADAGDIRIVWQGPRGRVRVRNLQVEDAGPLPLGAPTRGPFSPLLVGLHVNQLGRHDTWPDAGQKLLRLVSTGTEWYRLAPTREDFDAFRGPGWKRMDMYVDYARRNDPSIALLYTLGMPPPWASTDPDGEPCAAVKGTCGAPASLDEWRHYVRTLAERYRGRIRYWELWNEPDNRIFFTPKRSLAELARVAHDELKAVDPRNVLVSPGFTQATGLRWLHQFLHEGGGRWVDAIGFHWYYDGEPEKIAPLIHNVRQVMRQHGVADKPIWNTEGAPLCRGRPNGVCNMNGLSPAEQDGVVERAILTMWLNGVEAYAYYTAEGMGGRTLPLIGPDLKGTTPTAQKLRAFSTWMAGSRATAVSRIAGDGHAVELRRGNSVAYIVWSPHDEQVRALPADWSVTHYEPLGGERVRLPPGRLRIGPIPMLLTKD